MQLWPWRKWRCKLCSEESQDLIIVHNSQTSTESVLRVLARCEARTVTTKVSFLLLLTDQHCDLEIEAWLKKITHNNNVKMGKLVVIMDYITLQSCMVWRFRHITAILPKPHGFNETTSVCSPLAEGQGHQGTQCRITCNTLKWFPHKHLIRGQTSSSVYNPTTLNCQGHTQKQHVVVYCHAEIIKVIAPMVHDCEGIQTDFWLFSRRDQTNQHISSVFFLSMWEKETFVT